MRILILALCSLFSSFVIGQNQIIPEYINSKPGTGIYESAVNFCELSKKNPDGFTGGLFLEQKTFKLLGWNILSDAIRIKAGNDAFIYCPEARAMRDLAISIKDELEEKQVKNIIAGFHKNDSIIEQLLQIPTGIAYDTILLSSAQKVLHQIDLLKEMSIFKLDKAYHLKNENAYILKLYEFRPFSRLETFKDENLIYQVTFSLNEQLRIKRIDEAEIYYENMIHYAYDRFTMELDSSLIQDSLTEVLSESFIPEGNWPKSDFLLIDKIGDYKIYKVAKNLGLLDSTNQVKLEAKYWEIHDSKDHLIVKNAAGQSGLIKKENFTSILEPRYTRIRFAHNYYKDFFKMQEVKNRILLYGVANAEGKVYQHESYIYSELIQTPFTEKEFLIVVNPTRKKGIFDQEEKTLFPFQFEEISFIPWEDSNFLKNENLSDDQISKMIAIGKIAGDHFFLFSDGTKKKKNNPY